MVITKLLFELLDVSKIAFTLVEKKGLNFKSVMQKTQKYHGQAQKFDDFLVILQRRGYANGSTPKLFRSSTAIEDVTLNPLAIERHPAPST
jgi:hypothetical protein